MSSDLLGRRNRPSVPHLLQVLSTHEFGANLIKHSRTARPSEYKQSYSKIDEYKNVLESSALSRPSRKWTTSASSSARLDQHPSACPFSLAPRLPSLCRPAPS
jgi:hypothetical protein